MSKEMTKIPILETIEQLIALADQLYPDGEVARCVAEGECSDSAGDGLALFVVRELWDTFDAEATPLDKLYGAVNAMANAAGELNDVIHGLMDHMTTVALYEFFHYVVARNREPSMELFLKWVAVYPGKLHLQDYEGLLGAAYLKLPNGCSKEKILDLLADRVRITPKTLTATESE